MNFRLNFKISVKIISLFTRYANYITIGVVVLIAVFGYLSFISPKWDEVRSVGLNDYSKEQTKLENDKVYLSELKRLVSKYNNLNQVLLSNIEAILPESEELPAMFVQMAAMIEDAGMELSSVSFSTSAEPVGEGTSSVKVLVVELQVTGGTRYDDVKVLLNTIEKNQRLIDIISLKFNIDESEIISLEEDRTEGTYTINARTYYLRSDEVSEDQDLDILELINQ